jgi:hypothetical protein
MPQPLSRHRVTKIRTTSLFFLLALLGLATGTPGAVAQATRPADPYRISILTLGPGQEAYERFGHNAIVVEDLVGGSSAAFNYGVFSFEEAGFLLRFIRGRLIYWMQPEDVAQSLEFYRADGRAILWQELALTPGQKERLVRLLVTNARPENCRYLYNYYDANCSTKVRDALDAALDGQLRRQLAGRPGKATYRQYTDQAMERDYLLRTGLALVLGPATDRPLDRWEECFLPVELAGALRDVRVRDEHGAERLLVAREEQLTAEPLPVYRPAASRLGWDMLWVLPWTGLLIWGGLRAAAGRPRLLTWAGGLWVLASAAGGAILLFLLLTDHRVAHSNRNLLLLAPTALPLVVVWWLGMRRPGTGWARWLRRLLVATGVLTAAGVVARLQGSQDTTAILTLAGPLNAALVWAGLQACRLAAPTERNTP